SNCEVAQELYNEFEKQVKLSTAGVASFQQNFNSNRNLFTRATSIRHANPKGIVRVDRKDRIDFKSQKGSELTNEKSEKEKLEAVKAEATAKKDSRDEVKEGKPDDKDPEVTLEEFKKNNTDIQVEENLLRNEYKVCLPARHCKF